MKNVFKAVTIAICMMFSLVSCNTTEDSATPNILFCIADDASFPMLSAYGCSWVSTPSFDQIAEEGLLFNNAYTPNAKCAPSRSCILTGLNSWQQKEAANHWPYFPSELNSIVEVLKENGYSTAYTGKGWAPGIPGMRDGKERELTGTAYEKVTLVPPTHRIDVSDYSENFKAFMEEKDESKPWFFWYGGYEPHREYEYGSGVALGGKDIADIDSVPAMWPDNEVVRNDMLDYAFEVEYFDKELGEILKVLDEKGELENTIVIVTADNGMPFPRVKGQEYELSNHLPLAIMWKNGIENPGRKIDDLISFIDFAPTFADLAGIELSGDAAQFTLGKSMSDIFTSKEAGVISEDRDYVLIGKERHDVGRPNDEGYPMRGIIKGDFLFLQNYEADRWPAGNPITGYLNCDGAPTKTEIINAHRENLSDWHWQMSFGKRPQKEFYHIKDDPLCLNNLIDDEALTELISSMEIQMQGLLKEQDDPRMSGNGDIFDSYIYADSSGRDFYNRYMKGEKLPAGWVNKSDFEESDFE